jgi:hypothetical protein
MGVEVRLLKQRENSSVVVWISPAPASLRVERPVRLRARPKQEQHCIQPHTSSVHLLSYSILCILTLAGAIEIMLFVDFWALMTSLPLSTRLGTDFHLMSNSR